MGINKYKMKENKKVAVVITAEELEEFQALKEAKAKEDAKQRAREERDAYKGLAESTVDDMMPRIKALNRELLETKMAVYEAFRTLIDTKSNLFGIASSQRSHTFRNAQSSSRITIGFHQRDAWEDTVAEGIAKVKQYVSSLAKDSDSETLVNMILDLLSTDKQGNLQADKVLQLAKYADIVNDEEFSDGVRIIQEAYKPEKTKLFIRAEERNEQGKWVNVPLGITEA